MLATHFCQSLLILRVSADIFFALQDKVSGKAKEAFGSVTGDESKKNEGKAQNLGGKVILLLQVRDDLKRIFERQFVRLTTWKKKANLTPSLLQMPASALFMRQVEKLQMFASALLMRQVEKEIFSKPSCYFPF